MIHACLLLVAIRPATVAAAAAAAAAAARHTAAAAAAAAVRTYGNAFTNQLVHCAAAAAADMRLPAD